MVRQIPNNFQSNRSKECQTQLRRNRFSIHVIYKILHHFTGLSSVSLHVRFPISNRSCFWVAKNASSWGWFEVDFEVIKEKSLRSSSHENQRNKREDLFTSPLKVQFLLYDLVIRMTRILLPKSLSLWQCLIRSIIAIRIGNERKPFKWEDNISELYEFYKYSLGCAGTQPVEHIIDWTTHQQQDGIYTYMGTCWISDLLPPEATVLRHPHSSRRPQIR